MCNHCIIDNLAGLLKSANITKVIAERGCRPKFRAQPQYCAKDKNFCKRKMPFL